MVSLSSSNLLNLNSRTLHSYVSLPNPCKKLYRIRCAGENPPASNSTTEPESVPENALLKVAWNASELLGIATSFFRSPKDVKSAEQEARRLAADGSGSVDRTIIVQAIKEDFDRSYFVTGFPKPHFSFLFLFLFFRNLYIHHMYILPMTSYPGTCNIF